MNLWYQLKNTERKFMPDSNIRNPSKNIYIQIACHIQSQISSNFSNRIKITLDISGYFGIRQATATPLRCTSTLCKASSKSLRSPCGDRISSTAMTLHPKPWIYTYLIYIMYWIKMFFQIGFTFTVCILYIYIYT